MLHGLIVINKQPQITSHDVVSRVRKIFRIQKVGHFGTLDPMAEGLLLVGIGHVTKFFDFYVRKRKLYTGVIQFGVATDTYDRMGRPLSEPRPVDLYHEDLRSLKKKFTGSVLQRPPVYSAKKKNGKPLYRYARQNIDVRIPASRVHIYRLELLIQAPDRLYFSAETSAGTYIRSLAHDLGQALKVGAHLKELKRERIGEFSLKDAVNLDQLDAGMPPGDLIRYVQPIETLLPEFPALTLSHQGEVIARNGGTVFKRHITRVEAQKERGEFFRLFTLNGRFVALARRAEKAVGFKPFIVLPDQ